MLVFLKLVVLVSLYASVFRVFLFKAYLHISESM